MTNLLERTHKGLIVSCQAEGSSPFNNAAGVAGFAICARMGGAAAIRAEGVAHIKAIMDKAALPVIGLIKSNYQDGFVKISGRNQDIADLIGTGCDMLAVDGTFRLREGVTGPEFIRKIKKDYRVPVMADISVPEEAIACFEAGADCVSTTLSGYTPDTVQRASEGPDFDLLKKLVNLLSNKIPVIAEGRINTPELARQAIDSGAWAVVVGSAITRPQLITKWFYDEITKKV
ncbi:MAG: N-acetylmannosamine-6-phosphate 2-epimerase [Bacteroidales bacterium]|nr:N-acetylmannosamine-6-phosphate 2-epimerase [Bacteroidales bacterium]